MVCTLLALTLNEIDGVQAIMPQVEAYRRSGLIEQILVVDGGSTDGTVEWCRANGFEVYVQRRKGIRFAYLETLPLLKGDVILTISPDGNCPPESIPAVLEKMEQGYDLVIGSRYLGDAKSQDDDIVTGFGNWLFTRTVNLLHGGRYTDAMVIYRAFRRELIYDLDLDKEESYRLPERLFGTVISWEPLMAVRAAKARKRIGEVAVGEPPRIGGERKLQIFRWGAAYYFQFWWELFHWRPNVSHCEVHAGEITALSPGRTFIDGQYFSSITLTRDDGTRVQLREIFVINSLLDVVAKSRRGRLAIWNRHLYGFVGDDGTVHEDVAGARKAYFGRDRTLLIGFALSVVLLPVAVWVVGRRLLRAGSAYAMRRALVDGKAHGRVA